MITLFTTIERANAIKRRREELGLTLHDAANAIGITIGMLVDLESGKLYSHDWDRVHSRLEQAAAAKRNKSTP